MEMRATRTEQQRLIKPDPRRHHKELAGKNLKLARQMWGDLKPQSLQNLESYTTEFGFSIVAGDLLYLDKGWYVTHTGLIRLARRRRCVGIDVKPVAEFSDHADLSLGISGYRLQIHEVQRLCRIRRCRSIERLPLSVVPRCAWRDPSREPRTAQGLRRRPLLSRGNRSLRCSTQSSASRKAPQPANGNGITEGRTVRDCLCH